MHNLKKYTGPLLSKPKWNTVNPVPLSGNRKVMEVQTLTIPSYSDYTAFVVDDVLTKAECDILIHDFESQPTKYPVGVDGYGDPSSNIGSWRCMAWADGFDSVMNDVFEEVLYQTAYMERDRDGVLKASSARGDENTIFDTPFYPEKNYQLLGSTPWMRFMRYSSGGKHVPHYDAPFVNESEKYVTLYSWVMYLNDLDGEGGHFQFVNDGQREHPMDWNRDDWKRQATDDEIIHSIKPKAGRLLIFPHWLCHQVQEFVGFGHRYIIRGDVAYGY